MRNIMKIPLIPVLVVQVLVVWVTGICSLLINAIVCSAVFRNVN